MSETTAESLFALLDSCMLMDRARLLGAVRAARRHGDPARIERLRLALERSCDRAAQRRDRLPRPEFPAELPVSEKRAEIARAVAEHQVVVVCGETGSGKTTQLPKICLELGRGVRGMIGHTQPRRIAARSVASRIADELGTRLGSLVGYKVRFNDETSPETLIKVMTDGILLAETQADRSLHAYDTIIIDEAHERGLNIDFLLGYLRQLLPRRPELKVIVTSATIDPDRFSRHFASTAGVPAPIIEVSGRVYPVEVRYRPLDRAPDPELEEEEIDEDEPDLQDAIARAVAEVSAPGMPMGDVLIFLSGEREIRETAETLAARVPASTQILPLYARLSSDEQQRVFRVSAAGRRIILATNVAETSLTVPGIRYVIDPGFARISRYSARTKVQRLPIEKISRASADQRKGRCGRVSDGVCIRLYAQKDFEERPRFTDPEILRTNLASVILQMASLRLGHVDRFPFIEAPEGRMIRDGYETLVELGAITEDPGHGEPRLTMIGERLARLPLDPRIGRIILAGAEEGCMEQTLIVASFLSVQDPRERPMDLATKADAAHALFADAGSDFVAALKIWKAYQEQRKQGSGGRLRKWCREHFISYIRMREWTDVHEQLKELAAEIGIKSGPVRTNAKPGVPDWSPLHRALLAGLLSSIGVLPEATKQTVNRFEYHGPRGLRFNIFPGSGLFRKNPKWVVAAEIVKTTKSYARTVAAIDVAWVERVAAHLLKRSHSEPYWDERRAQVWASEKVTLFGLELVPRRAVHFGTIDPKVSREIFIHHALVEGGYWSNQPFSKHNRALIAEVEGLSHRLRSRDFALDVTAQFEFFNSRVPEGVYSGQTFEHWLRGAQQKDPKILFMSMDALLKPGWGMDRATLERKYPSALVFEMGGERSSLKLDYLFKPGDASDGVTIVTPVEMLGLLTQERLSWLVPGYLPEKAVALMRTLPKDVRRSLVPIPEFAEKALNVMAMGAGRMEESLAQALGRVSGVEVQAPDFDAGGLAPELRFNVRVVEAKKAGAPDEAPKVLAEGRDLEVLQGTLRGVVRSSLAGSERTAWSREGLTTWDFEQLPSEVIVERGGMRFPAYPALVDERAAAARPAKERGHAPTPKVSLRLFETRDKAERAMRRGTRRLLALQAREEIRWHIERSRELHAMLVEYGPIGAGSDLKEDLCDVIAEVAFMSPVGATGAGRSIRTRIEFEAAREAGWSKIERSAGDVIRAVHAVLLARQGLALRFPEFVKPPSAQALAAPALMPSISDVRLQLAVLIPPGFVGGTSWAWLRHIPRYLQAVDRRAQRLMQGGPSGIARDTKLMDEVRPFWVALLDRARRFHEIGRDEPALDDFRWAIEEFRVSLFAQELGTIEPISAKRLEKKWAEIPE